MILSARPLLYAGNVLILEFLEVLFCRFPCAPLKVIVDKYRCASIEVHQLVYQVAVEENE
jgi:hypothetical protein